MHALWACLAVTFLPFPTATRVGATTNSNFILKLRDEQQPQVFTGASCAQWLRNNVDEIVTDDDLLSATYSLLKYTAIAHADERNVENKTDFLAEENVW